MRSCYFLFLLTVAGLFVSCTVKPPPPLAAADGSGRIYVAGDFEEEIRVYNFDTVPGPATPFIASQTTAGAGIYLLTYEDGAATPIAARTALEFSDGKAGAVAADESGYCIGGQFEESLTIAGNPPRTDQGRNDGFIACFDRDHTLRWYQQIRGSGEANVLVLRIAGNSIFAAGSLEGRAAFPGSSKLEPLNLSTEGSGSDAFIAAYDRTSGDFKWVNRTAGSRDDAYRTLAVEESPTPGKVYAGGEFRSAKLSIQRRAFTPNIFNPPGSGFTLANEGGRDGFLVAYNASTGLATRRHAFGGNGTFQIKSIETNRVRLQTSSNDTIRSEVFVAANVKGITLGSLFAGKDATLLALLGEKDESEFAIIRKNLIEANDSTFSGATIAAEDSSRSAAFGAIGSIRGASSFFQAPGADTDNGGSWICGYDSRMPENVPCPGEQLFRFQTGATVRYSAMIRSGGIFFAGGISNPLDLTANSAIGPISIFKIDDIDTPVNFLQAPRGAFGTNPPGGSAGDDPFECPVGVDLPLCTPVDPGGP